MICSVISVHDAGLEGSKGQQGIVAWSEAALGATDAPRRGGSFGDVSCLPKLLLLLRMMMTMMMMMVILSAVIISGCVRFEPPYRYHSQDPTKPTHPPPAFRITNNEKVKRLQKRNIFNSIAHYSNLQNESKRMETSTPNQKNNDKNHFSTYLQGITIKMMNFASPSISFTKFHPPMQPGHRGFGASHVALHELCQDLGKKKKQGRQGRLVVMLNSSK